MSDSQQRPLAPDMSELRQLTIDLKNGDVNLALGKRSIEGLCKMLDDPQLVAVHNISSLSKEIGLSPASVSRMARILGFEGFTQFQDIFRRRVRDPNRFYSKQARELFSGERSDADATISTLADQLRENISFTLRENHVDTVAMAVDWLAQSAHVQILGYRQSAALSLAMSYGLSMIRSQVQAIGVTGQGLTIALSQLRAGDVLVLICSSPYSRDTVEAARIAAARDARIVALTDSHLSPLTESADLLLLAPSESRYFSSSMSSALFMIEALLTLTARRLGGRAIKNLELREDMISRLNDGY